MNALDEAFQIKQYMVEQRNYFHSHPELGLQEFNTCNRIEEELTKSRISSRRIAGTNVIAEIDSGKPGKTLFIRADIDALPIKEENDVPYKSQNEGIMHACGHDGHAAYLLGAAKLIKKHTADFAGKVVLCFQAAEEIGKGARDVLAAGILDDVDRIFGIHFQAGLDVGKYGIKTGADMASCDRFKIQIHGKAAHITKPQNGADSVFIGALIVTQLQTVVSRLVSPVEGGLIGVGSFHSGTTYNIIPAEAVLEGTIRAFSPANRKKLADAVTKISTDVAHTYGATVDVDIEDLSDSCTNPEDTAAEVVESAKKIVGAQNVLTTIDKRFGSDNFADFMRKAPGTYVHVGSTDSDTTRYPHHNGHFDLAQDSLPYAAALALQYVLDYLK
ncbi:MAG: amidohydrolase [Spirochaetaceae bacterium]|nr:amidohydrolase [Spirochaetaceae bacterium]